VGAVTIKDIAIKSGYSITTVSRVLSGSDYPVNEDTKRAIKQCADSMGYVPNMVARSLKTNSNKEIAIIIPSFRNPFYTSIITGIENTLGQSGYSMLFYLHKRWANDPEELISNLTSKMVSGVIIASNCIGSGLAKGLQTLKKKGIPVIVFDADVEGFTDLNGVFFDYRRGGRLSAQKLYRSGHRSVALATLDLNQQATRRSFVGGFCEFYREMGFPLREDRDIFQSSGISDFAIGVKLAGMILDSGRTYTAIAVNNDSVAAGVISGLLQRGLRVPEDMSVIGMDDNVFSSMTTPLLTTVRIPSLDMGNLAARYLLDEIEGKPLEFSIYMQSGLVERQSVRDLEQSPQQKTMHLYVLDTKEELGTAAARFIAKKINAAIEKQGYARIILSTGISQFEMLGALVKENVDWSKVSLFQLDDYVGLPISHFASPRKYLTERFVNLVHPKEVCFVNAEGDVEKNIAELTEKLNELPIDVGVIGIGENAHIAFNDPPADFCTTESYRVVNLNERCKLQQVGEGWFNSVEDVPKQAVSMTPHSIMACRCIVSPVPRIVKAEAIAAVLRSEAVDPMIPGTLLKTHPDFHLFTDCDSVSLCSEADVAKYKA